VEGSTFRGIWNPFKSGRTYLEIEPFVHWQSFDSEHVTFEEYKTSGIGLGLYYDNTDYINNPTQGSWQRIKVKRDPGSDVNTFAWTALEVEAAKYFSLGESRLWRQQTIGINFWTAWSPTWAEVIEGGQIRTINRPPDYYGAHLGGFYRMRAFPQRRFHDKAGIYYSLEYRVMPRWQPLPEIKWFRPFEVDWWQLAFFMEAGRVAPEWNVRRLHDEMKLDFGISLRMMIMKSIGRLDVAVSDESTSVTVLVGHPF
jgi:outer membrane protein assembly factor BamA